MTNYNDLTQEKKESITKELRYLFEELIDNYYVEGKCLFDNDNNNWKSPEYLCLKREIKGFQEGEKLAIKIIEKQIEFISNQRSELIYILNYSYTHFLCMRFEKEIEELKKQREHLEWESGLE